MPRKALSWFRVVLVFNAATDDDFSTENKFNGFHFSTKVGYQFTDNWTLGLDASISFKKNETTIINQITPIITVVAVNENKTTNFSIGPFARYTMPINETFRAYADMGVKFYFL